MLCNLIPTYREKNTTLLKKLMVAINYIWMCNILPNRFVIEIRKISDGTEAI